MVRIRLSVWLASLCKSICATLYCHIHTVVSSGVCITETSKTSKTLNGDEQNENIELLTCLGGWLRPYNWTVAGLILSPKSLKTFCLEMICNAQTPAQVTSSSSRYTQSSQRWKLVIFCDPWPMAITLHVFNTWEEGARPGATIKPCFRSWQQNIVDKNINISIQLW